MPTSRKQKLQSSVREHKPLVATSLTLGNVTGAYAVNASCPGCTPGINSITFGATAVSTASVAKLTKHSCDLSGFLGELLDNPLKVRVRDTKNNKYIPGFGVDFTLIEAPAGSAGAAPASFSTVTFKNGIAKMPFTLGDTPGDYKIKASCPSCEVNTEVICNVSGIPKPQVDRRQPIIRTLSRALEGTPKPGEDLAVIVTPTEVVPVDEDGKPLISGKPSTAFVVITGPKNAPFTAKVIPTQNSGGHQDHAGRENFTGTLNGAGNTYAGTTDPFGLSAEDVQRINQIYYRTVREMTWTDRLPFGPLNNLSAFIYNTTRGQLGGDYQLCVGQVSTVRRSLTSAQQRKPFDAQWTFQDYPVHLNFHMKLKATSSDPNDPVIIFDPWWRLWY